MVHIEDNRGSTLTPHQGGGPELKKNHLHLNHLEDLENVATYRANLSKYSFLHSL